MEHRIVFQGTDFIPGTDKKKRYANRNHAPAGVCHRNRFLPPDIGRDVDTRFCSGRVPVAGTGCFDAGLGRYCCVAFPAVCGLAKK